eukprot:TRINITY_DN707_c0_g1_i1.p1 TRINITY_DN707_c0_g1~~TRINITY_DN707_c0_g1_i1.p1  ORF type:complete len:235 (+),score=19.71 TRINITY_DN707_c0_g1_i1:442-1146(+)
MFGSKYNPGIVPMVLDSLFESIAKAEQGQWEYSVEVSFMEIYNNEARDLFKEDCSVVKRSPGKGAQLEGVTKLTLMSAGDVEVVLSRGLENRCIRYSRLACTSSRSSLILQIDLTATNPVLKKQRHSRINLVDLAGSERVRSHCPSIIDYRGFMSTAVSLNALGRVLCTLAEKCSPNKKKYVAYRDSTLTWILSESLGGNSKTMMIATVSPAERHRDETYSSLRFLSKVVGPMK